MKKLPCPFCGCTTLSIVTRNVSIYSQDLTVACDTCYARGPTRNTKLKAEQSWNSPPKRTGQAVFGIFTNGELPADLHSPSKLLVGGSKADFICGPGFTFYRIDSYNHAVDRLGGGIQLTAAVLIGEFDERCRSKYPRRRS